MQATVPSELEASARAASGNLVKELADKASPSGFQPHARNLLHVLAPAVANCKAKRNNEAVIQPPGVVTMYMEAHLNGPVAEQDLWENTQMTGVP